MLGSVEVRTVLGGADAGEPLSQFTIPENAPPFDRERLYTAFRKHGLSPYSFSGG